MKCSETGTERLNRRGRGEEMEKCRRCQTKNRMELPGITRITSDEFDVLADERTHFPGRNRNSSNCDEGPAAPLAVLDVGMSAGGPASGARPHRQRGPSGRYAALVPEGEPWPGPWRGGPTLVLRRTESTASCRKIDRFVV